MAQGMFREVPFLPNFHEFDLQKLPK